MPSKRRNADRARLERELSTGEYQEMLKDLKTTNPFLRRFANWQEMLTVISELPPKSVVKDEFLRPIYAAIAEDDDPRWRDILLVIFWPCMESIYIHMLFRDEDTDALWTSVQWAFFEAICGVDLGRRRDWLAKKILNDAYHNIRRGYSEQEANRARCVPLDVAEWAEERKDEGGDEDDDRRSKAPDSPMAEPDREIARFEARDTIDGLKRQLWQEVEAGRLREVDYYLLVGTEIYRKTIADCAGKLGITPEAAKKRRQRAIHIFERVRKQLSHWASPAPLSLVKGGSHPSRTRRAE